MKDCQPLFWGGTSKSQNNLNDRDLPLLAMAFCEELLLWHIVPVSSDQGNNVNLFDFAQTITPCVLRFFRQSGNGDPTSIDQVQVVVSAYKPHGLPRVDRFQGQSRWMLLRFHPGKIDEEILQAE